METPAAADMTSITDATAPGTDNATAPAADNVTAPAADNVTAPAADNATAPGTDNATAPAADNATAPAADNATAPAADNVTPPAAENVTAPARYDVTLSPGDLDVTTPEVEFPEFTLPDAPVVYVITPVEASAADVTLSKTIEDGVKTERSPTKEEDSGIEGSFFPKIKKNMYVKKF